ncbi:MAG: outer membrane beta-barrel protein, partial [Chthoniobacterales bacterium]
EDDTESDLIASFLPTFMVGMGDFHSKSEDYFSLEYQPYFNFYTDHSYLNRVNQNLEVDGQATFSRYSTSLLLNYINTDQPNAVQNGRSSYQTLNATWQNSYYLTAKVFLRLILGLNNQSYENGDEYQTYSVSPLLGYDITQKLTLTFGPSAGISYIGSSENENSSDSTQNFQGVNLGIVYNYSDKLQFDSTLGIQSRQYNGVNQSGASNFTTPVFNISASYAATAKTSFVLQLLRDVQLSDLLQGQTYTNSQVIFTVSHTFSPHFSASMDLNYQYLQYQGSSTNDHVDKYAQFVPRLTYTFWREQCRLSAYYRWQERTSTLQNSNYSVNAYGLQFSYDF